MESFFRLVSELVKWDLTTVSPFEKVLLPPLEEFIIAPSLGNNPTDGHPLDSWFIFFQDMKLTADCC